LVLITLFLGSKPAQGANAKANVPALPPMSLTVAGANGAQIVLNASISLTMVGANGTEVVLNATDIAGLPSYRGYGGFKKRTGSLGGLGNYTGVPLNTLCNLVGGISADNSLFVLASDKYNITLTYAQVEGDFITYNKTGQQVPHNQPLVPILAYYFDDANLTSGEGGPLRLAIVGPEGLLTNSTLWVKYVVSMKVLENGMPEFPSLVIFPLLLLATLVAALSLKTQRQHRIRRYDSRDSTEERDISEMRCRKRGEGI
jgi:hypothetical protein